MTTDDQRDAEMDRLLRSTLTPSPHGGAGDCPDPELLAAYGEGSLPVSERLSIETHLAACPRCQSTLSAYARALPEPVASPAAKPTWLRGGHLRWLIPVAAASGLVLYVASRSVVAPSFLPTASAPSGPRSGFCGRP